MKVFGIVETGGTDVRSMGLIDRSMQILYHPCAKKGVNMKGKTNCSSFMAINCWM